MSYLIGFLIFQWYGSLFFQTFFHHRYAAHSMFKMNKFWEKVFFFFSFIFQGASYLSPNTYGILHRMHHAHTDTKKDPHSPTFQKSIIEMMFQTRSIYLDIDKNKIKVDDIFKENLPVWKSFDLFAQSRFTRLGWVFIYVGIYYFFAKDNWLLYFLLPISILMSPIHGVIVNWFSHKIGYRNFNLNNTSTNLFPLDFLMWGEGLHNNHHKNANNPNFAVKWFEIDPLYPFILVLDKLKIIQLNKI